MLMKQPEEQTGNALSGGNGGELMGSKISPKAYVDHRAIVDEKSKIDDDVYVAPCAQVTRSTVLRGANVQDRVVLEDAFVGEDSSCAHWFVNKGHLGYRSFGGMHAVIEKGGQVGDDCVIEPFAKISGGVDISEGTFVSAGFRVTNENLETLRKVGVVGANDDQYPMHTLNDGVIHVNKDLAAAWPTCNLNVDGPTGIETANAPAVKWCDHKGICPVISENGVNIGNDSIIVGGVQIKDNVTIGRRAILRGDEGQPFIIDEGADLGDDVQLHALETEKLESGKNVPIPANQVDTPDGVKAAIYVGKQAAIGDKVQLHGPVLVGDDSFIGDESFLFKAKVDKATVIGDGCVIMGAEIGEGAKIEPGLLIRANVPAGCQVRAHVPPGAKLAGKTEWTQEDLEEFDETYFRRKMYSEPGFVDLSRAD